VQAQQPRPRAHGARNLEPALVAVGQAAGRVVRARLEADAREPVARALDRLRLGGAIAPAAEEAADGIERSAHESVVLRHDQVLERGHGREQADVLERAHHAGARDAHVAQALEAQRLSAAIQGEAAGARAVEAGEAVEHGGLAGAVGADDGGDGARVGAKREVVDRGHALEAHAQPLDREQWRAHEGARSGRRSVGSRQASRPCGRQTMISTMAAPNASSRNCANSRPNSGSSVRNSAASTTPTWLPMPPSTTMATMVADSTKVKLSGLMKPWRVAKKAPAKPPNMAPMAKAVSLVLRGLMPSARQAISSSRSASHARPTGRRRMRRVKKLVTSASARIR